MTPMKHRMMPTLAIFTLYRAQQLVSSAMLENDVNIRPTNGRNFSLLHDCNSRTAMTFTD
jgi:hypothetical protein